MQVGDDAVIFARRLRNDWMMLLPGEDVSEPIEIPATVVTVEALTFTLSYKDLETGQETLKAFTLHVIPEHVKILPRKTEHRCGVEGCEAVATTDIILSGGRHAYFCDHCAGQIAIWYSETWRLE